MILIIKYIPSIRKTYVGKCNFMENENVVTILFDINLIQFNCNIVKIKDIIISRI